MQMLKYIYVMPRDDIVPTALGSVSDLKSIQMGPRGENFLETKYVNVNVHICDA